MTLLEGIKVKGQLTVNYKKNGEILWSHTQNNMVTANGLFCLASMLIGSASFDITKLGFGDGDTEPTSADDSMSGDYYRIESSFMNTGNWTTESYNKAKFYWSIDYNTDISGQTFYLHGGGTEVWPVGNAFTIKELSMWSFSDTMFNRIVWHGPLLVMDTDITLDGDFTITVL